MTQNTDGVQLVVAPTMDANGNPMLILGFHSLYFSQCVNLPYTTEEDMEKLIAGITQGIRDAVPVMNGGKRNAILDTQTRI